MPNFLTRPAGLPSNTAVAHITDSKTGNVYPVVLSGGHPTASPPPSFIRPGTINTVVRSGRGLPAGGSGVWWSPGSSGGGGSLVNPATSSTTADVAASNAPCPTCQQVKQFASQHPDWFLLLMMAGIVVLLVVVVSLARR